MTRPGRTTRLAAAAVAAATLAACGQQAAAPPAGAATPTAATECPAAPMPALPAGANAGGPPAIATATSVGPVDTAGSEVLTELNGPQIQCGRAPVTTRSGIVFSTPTGADGKPRPLSLDLISPADGRPHPLVVYVTGGGFASAVRTNGLPLRTYLAEAGFTVASIEYRTQPEGATFVDGVADVKSAVRFLRAEAKEFGIVPDKVALWGESAGGYLVAMAGTTAGDDVQAVVDKFGASDVSRIGEGFDAAMQAAYADPHGVIAQYTKSPDPKDANPAALAAAGDPPFLLQHGTADTIISPVQTLILHNALKAAGVDSTRWLLQGAGHGDLAFLGDPAAGLPWSTALVMDRTVEWLRGHIAS